MASFAIQGTVKTVGREQSFASGFFKRELVVLNDDGKYTQELPFEFLKEKGALLEGLREGERVEVHFDLRGREHNGRYFISASGWKVERLSAPLPAEPDAEPSTPEPELLEDMPF